ncbi:hypothetical protein SGCOL_009380 [Colletotrichum sp. CLE4]
MALIEKALTESFYGTPPKYTYFYGGSTGGRQAYMLTQRYPNDFDGILGFCPAINWDKFQWSPLWAHRDMDKKVVYPRPCEFEAITAAATKACDRLDRVENGIVSMPSRSFFDTRTLVGHPFDCGGTDALFTAEAAEAANAAWNGPQSISGEFHWFRKAGGKLLSWHGMTDQIIPVNVTVDYTDRVLKKDPKAHDYFRQFLAPGADHSISNALAPRNTLSALIDWVDKGIAPVALRVEGLNAYGKQMRRDICMYPQVQHYIGGDPASPASFACV